MGLEHDPENFAPAIPRDERLGERAAIGEMGEFARSPNCSVVVRERRQQSAP